MKNSYAIGALSIFMVGVIEASSPRDDKGMSQEPDLELGISSSSLSYPYLFPLTRRLLNKYDIPERLHDNVAKGLVFLKPANLLAALHAEEDQEVKRSVLENKSKEIVVNMSPALLSSDRSSAQSPRPCNDNKDPKEIEEIVIQVMRNELKKKEIELDAVAALSKEHTQKAKTYKKYSVAGAVGTVIGVFGAGISTYYGICGQ